MIDGVPARVRITRRAGREPGVRRHAARGSSPAHHRARRRGTARLPRCSPSSADDASRCASELVATAKRMSALGLTPGMSGNVSVRSARGLLRHADRACRTTQLRPTTPSQIDADGTARPGQRAPTTRVAAPPRHPRARAPTSRRSSTRTRCSAPRCRCCAARSPRSTTWSCSPACDEIPCAEYATFGSAELATNVVARAARRRTRACWRTTAWSRSAPRSARAAARRRDRDARRAVLARASARHAARARRRGARARQGSVSRVRAGTGSSAAVGRMNISGASVSSATTSSGRICST